jgi:hypothetical protein
MILKILEKPCTRRILRPGRRQWIAIAETVAMCCRRGKEATGNRNHAQRLRRETGSPQDAKLKYVISARIAARIGN